MKKNIKIILVAIIIIIVLGSIILSSTKGISAETYDVKKDYTSYYFTETGIVGNENYYNLYSKNSGDVLLVNVKVGDTIKKGDVIGEISGENLNLEITTAMEQIKGYNSQIDNIVLEDNSRKNTIDSSIADLKSQIQTLEIQQSTGDISKNEQIKIQNLLIEQSEKDLEKLIIDLNKYEILLQEGIISQSDYNELQQQVQSYENIIEQNKNQLTILETGGSTGNSDYFESTKNAIEIQIKNLEKQLNMDYTSSSIDYYNSLIAISTEQLKVLNKLKDELVIKSTVDGTISELPIATTNYITAGTPVAIIKENNNLIESHISTRDIDSVHIGQKVNIIINKRQGESVISGSVYSIDNEAKLTINPLGLEERKIKVLIEPLENLNLINGFDVDIEYLLYEKDNDIAIPKESIFKYNDGDAVYKLINNTATITPITKGIELRNTFVIDEGLVEGDIIILDANNDDMKNGVKIN